MSHEISVSSKARRWVTIGGVAGAVIVIAGLLMLWPDRSLKIDRLTFGFASKVYGAKVQSVTNGSCDNLVSQSKCVRVKLQAGPDTGDVVDLDMFDSPSTPKLKVGDEIVMSYQEDAEPGFEYQFADRQRRKSLIGVAVLFAAAVIALGRWRGLTAIGGLLASLIVIVKFILPAILIGKPPVLVACVGAGAIAYCALYLAHGFNVMTTVALLGALFSLCVTVLMSSLFVSLSQFSGLSTEESSFIKLVAEQVSPTGLLLAGIVIASLGALDDMTVTQASAVIELKQANPAYKVRELFHSAMNIGRDHVASTVNTLALAYAGAALPLMLLFVLSGQSLGTVANSEVIAVEIVGALVGSIGLVISVPLTTVLAAVVVCSDMPLTAPTMEIE